MQLQENISLAPKTTMRIGGKARYYAELKTKSDAEEAYAFAKQQEIPLIVLGGGSNTIFDDELIEALVVRVVAQDVSINDVKSRGDHVALRDKRSTRNVYVEVGKNLAQLINELANQNLDLSPLTGILGTVGGAVFGNAGQGHGGIWIGSYVQEVEVFLNGEWKTFTREQCNFRYRSSAFKDLLQATSYPSDSAEAGKLQANPIIWSATLNIPKRPKEEVKAEITRLLQRRIETQPHVKTAGSCFLTLPDGTPAWKVIDAAGLRGKKQGSLCVSEKHANFLIAHKGATFKDAKTLVEEIRSSVDTSLVVEMRFIGKEGKPVF